MIDVNRKIKDDSIDAFRYAFDSKLISDKIYNRDYYNKYILGRWDNVFDPNDYNIDDLYKATSSDHPSFRGGMYKDTHALDGKELGFVHRNIQETINKIYLNYCVYKDDIEVEMNPITLFMLFRHDDTLLEMYKDEVTYLGFNVVTTYSLPYDKVFVHCRKLNKHACTQLEIPNFKLYDDIYEKYEGDDITMKLPKKYIVNKNAVILFDSNDKKTVVKRYKEDIPDPVKGFLWAYFIKNCGMTRTKANKYLEDIKEQYIEQVAKSKKD